MPTDPTHPLADAERPTLYRLGRYAGQGYVEATEADILAHPCVAALRDEVRRLRSPPTGLEEEHKPDDIEGAMARAAEVLATDPAPWLSVHRGLIERFAGALASARRLAGEVERGKVDLAEAREDALHALGALKFAAAHMLATLRIIGAGAADAQRLAAGVAARHEAGVLADYSDDNLGKPPEILTLDPRIGRVLIWTSDEVATMRMRAERAEKARDAHKAEADALRAERDELISKVAHLDDLLTLVHDAARHEGRGVIAIAIGRIGNGNNRVMVSTERDAEDELATVAARTFDEYMAVLVEAHKDLRVRAAEKARDEAQATLSASLAREEAMREVIEAAQTYRATTGFLWPADPAHADEVGASRAVLDDALARFGSEPESRPSHVISAPGAALRVTEYDWLPGEQSAPDHDRVRREGAHTIGDALRLVRERSRRTMGDLARFLGVRVTVVSDIERGKLDKAREILATQPEPALLSTPCDGHREGTLGGAPADCSLCALLSTPTTDKP